MRLNRSIAFAAAAIALGSAFTSARCADPIAHESLAFIPDPGPGPDPPSPDPHECACTRVGTPRGRAGTPLVPGSPFPRWTRVAFAPKVLAGFPEELRFLRRIPSPGRGPSGIAVSDDSIWVACAGELRIHRLDLSTGRPLGSFPAPGPRPAGLSWDGESLWHADRSGKVFRLDRDGAVRSSFAAGLEPLALWAAGGRILTTDAASDRIHVLDAASGIAVSAEPAPEKALTGLVSAGGAAWWCASGSELIRFDRARGLPVCGFSVAPPHPAPCSIGGLARRGDELWIADAARGEIVAIREPAHGEYVAAAGRHRRARFDMTYRNRSRKEWEDLRILQHVPFLEMPGHRYLSLRIDPTPQALFRDELGNVIALVALGRVPPGGAARVGIEAVLWTADRRQVVDPDLFPETPPAGDRAALLAPYFAIDGEGDPAVAALFRDAAGEKNPYWKIRKAHDAVCRAIYYKEPGTDSLPRVLRLGYGVCRHYSAFLCAAGRQLGVPVLNSWAPRHETCVWMLPGILPSIMEVTEDDQPPDGASSWARSRWLLGTQRGEITTGVRTPSMHRPVEVGGRPFVYGWHYWRPADVEGLAHEGGWKVTWEAKGPAERK